MASLGRQLGLGILPLCLCSTRITGVLLCLLSIHVNARDLHTAPQACVTSTLPTESAPHLQDGVSFSSASESSLVGVSLDWWFAPAGGHLSMSGDTCVCQELGACRGQECYLTLHSAQGGWPWSRVLQWPASIVLRLRNLSTNILVCSPPTGYTELCLCFQFPLEWLCS